MIHELLLSPTETASGSHPCCVVSVTYHRPSFTAVTRVQIPSGTPTFQWLRGNRPASRRHKKAQISPELRRRFSGITNVFAGVEPIPAGTKRHNTRRRF